MSLTQLGRFRISGTLGHGATGVVYQAHDPLTGRTVAVRTVNCSGLSHEEAEAAEQRFQREARSAGRLDHPNIVSIHGVGRSDDLAYIALEFVAGQSLRDLLDSGRVLPPERIAEIAAQIADGLAFAHASNVVHRDLKPASIMVLDNGAVKIANFGIAPLSDSSRAVADTDAASPHYRSPEQVTGQKADGRSDIFALGAVLYEMLTGRPPFTGNERNAIFDQVLNVAPPPPSSHNPDMPQGFDRIVARAMAKDPDQRYQNADDMATDLRNYHHIAELPQPVQPSGSAPPATTPPAEATVPPTPAAAPGGFARVLRYGAPLVVVALLAAAYLPRSEAPLASSTPPPPSSAAPEPRQIEMTDTTKAEQPVPQVVDSQIDVAEPAAEAVEAVAEAEEAVEAVAEAAPATRTATPRVAAEGRIRLAIAPWGEVYVDGKKAGVSPPLAEIRLPPGKHRIEIRNSVFAPRRQDVDLAPNASVRIKHKFE